MKQQLLRKNNNEEFESSMQRKEKDRIDPSLPADLEITDSQGRDITNEIIIRPH